MSSEYYYIFKIRTIKFSLYNLYRGIMYTVYTLLAIFVGSLFYRRIVHGRKNMFLGNCF